VGVPTIHVSAAGNGLRLKEAVIGMGYDEDFPKHLLPIGRGQTLLGHIIKQALQMGAPVIYANQSNRPYFQSSASVPANVAVCLTPGVTPLSPVIEHVRVTRTRGYAQAGDTWSGLNWQAFAAFHEKHDLPVSMAVGPYPLASEGTRLAVDSTGRIISATSVTRTKPADLSPAGACII
jgi:hypothetical protein